MSMAINDDDLSAYIDGELAADKRELIDRSLPQDSLLAERVQQLKEINSLIATTYEGIDREPIPESVMALLQDKTGALQDKTGEPQGVSDDAVALQGKNHEHKIKIVSNEAQNNKAKSNKAKSNLVGFPAERESSKQVFKASAIAASVALFLGITVGTQIVKTDSAYDGGLVVASIAKPGSNLYKALESQPSGSAEQTPKGEIQPLLSFKSTTGEFCREFILREQAQSTRAVACRAQIGWQTRFASFSDAVKPSSEHFIVASSADAESFSNMIANMMAEDALSLPEESKLLNKWEQ